MVPMLLAQGSLLRTTNSDYLGTSQYSPDLNRAALWLVFLLKPCFGVTTVTLTIVLLERPPLMPWFLIFLVKVSLENLVLKIMGTISTEKCMHTWNFTCILLGSSPEQFPEQRKACEVTIGCTRTGEQGFRALCCVMLS